LRERKTFLAILGGIACAQPRTNDGSCVARLNAALANIVAANTAPFLLLLLLLLLLLPTPRIREVYRKANERVFADSRRNGASNFPARYRLAIRVDLDR
jgi:hypothetical protein